MRYFSRSIAAVVCGLAVILLGACQPSRTVTPAPLLPPVKLGLAPFTQPVQTSHLLAGFIPQPQGLAAPEDILALNTLMQEKLGGTGRSFVVLAEGTVTEPLGMDHQGRRNALASWIEKAREAQVELLVVPQVIDWNRRVGGEAGALKPAAVTVDFFLIDARGEGALLQRSHYAERQQALADNLLTLGDFVQRKGRWLSAEELAGEGMDKAIKEFGL